MTDTSPEGRIARCDEEIERCRRASDDPSLSLTERIGAQHGELDWLVAKQLIEEEHSA